MRPIKFRAWDEQKKIMHNDFQFFASGDEGNDWICFCSDKEPRDTHTLKEAIVFKNPYFRQQLKIMQFTGLHDKNMREIYEGDFVTFGNWKPGEWKIGWNADCARWDLFEPSGTWMGLCNEDDEKVMLDLMVVGNIYENPELLEAPCPKS